MCAARAGSFLLTCRDLAAGVTREHAGQTSNGKCTASLSYTYNVRDLQLITIESDVVDLQHLH